MIKNGFTLAEVLITLAIVGLVASLTLPGLNSNINNRRIGPALAKAINTLENANKMILVENEISTLNENGDESYFTSLQETLNASRVDNVFTGKDGIVYTIEYPARVNTSATSAKYSGIAYRVGIDVNGTKRPNLANSDRFLAYIDTRGAVIAAGGNEIERIYGMSNVLAQCEAGDTVTASPMSFGTCTEAVINAGWEVPYTVVSSGTPNQKGGLNWILEAPPSE